MTSEQQGLSETTLVVELNADWTDGENDAAEALHHAMAALHREGVVKCWAEGPPLPGREEVARIVDPEAFRLPRAVTKRRPDLFTATQLGKQMVALAKADLILAACLRPPVGGGLGSLAFGSALGEPAKAPIGTVEPSKDGGAA